MFRLSLRAFVLAPLLTVGCDRGALSPPRAEMLTALVPRDQGPGAPTAPVVVPPLAAKAPAPPVIARPAAERPGAAPSDTPQTSPTPPAPSQPTEAVPPPPASPAHTFATRPDALPPDLLATLSAEVDEPSRQKARALNKSGLDKQRANDLAGAIADYRGALELHPDAAFPRYNLACALSVSGATDESIHQLAILAHLAHQDDKARDRLAAARLDKDFDRLRATTAFRTLTLSTPVLVTWASGRSTSESDQALAKDIVRALREARWEAQLATTPWQLPVDRSAMRARRDLDSPELDQVTLTASEQVYGVLERIAPGTFERDPEGRLPADIAPIVIIVASPDSEPAEPEPGAAETASDPLAPFLGRSLRHEGDDGRETLTLETKGHFTWDLMPTTGEPRRLSGRWALRLPGDGEPPDAPMLLELNYRESPLSPPDTVVEGEALENTLPLRIRGRFLEIDGVAFR